MNQNLPICKCVDCGAEFTMPQEWLTGDPEIDALINTESAPCDTCNAKRIEKRTVQEEAAQMYETQFSNAARYKAANLPEFHLTLNTKQLAMIPACFAENLWDKSRSGLMLIGPNRTWKTAVMVHLAKRALDKTKAQVEFYTAAELFIELAGKHCQEQGEFKRFVKHLSELDMLIIDDWSITEKKVNMTDSRSEAAFYLIDTISKKKRGSRLMITSNDKPSEFKAAFGEAIFERLKEMCVITSATNPQYNKGTQHES